MYIYIYIYKHTKICVCLSLSIYIYIERERDRDIDIEREIHSTWGISRARTLILFRAVLRGFVVSANLRDTLWPFCSGEITVSPILRKTSTTIAQTNIKIMAREIPYPPRSEKGNPTIKSQQSLILVTVESLKSQQEQSV